jgi:hypothetical protein
VVQVEWRDMRSWQRKHMLCRWVLPVILATAPIPALAAKRVTAEQLRRMVSDARYSHRTDDVAAQQLVGVKLTARLSGAPLQRLVSVSPGPKATQALNAIADLSVFLELPADQLPATSAPDRVTQKQSSAGRSIT